jgi:hypothetical protein
MAHLPNTAVRQSQSSIQEASAIQPEGSSALAERLEAGDQVTADLLCPLGDQGRIGDEAHT